MFNIRGFSNTGDYLKVGDNFLLNISDTGYYTLNGEDVYIWSTKQFLLTETPALYSRKVGKTSTSHYECDGSTLTTEHVHNVRDKFLDEDGYPYYPTLEIEFEHRKELEAISKYEAVVKKEEDIRTEIPVNCVGVAEDTGSPYIENALAYGKAKFQPGSFYRVNNTSIVGSELNNFLDEHNLRSRYKPSDHSGTYYSKIDDKYVLTSLDFSKKGSYGYATSLEEAKAQERKVRQEVRNTLNIKVFGADAKLSGDSLLSVYNCIESWKSMLGNIDYKVSSRSKYHSLQNSLEKTLKSLNEYMK